MGKGRLCQNVSFVIAVLVALCGCIHRYSSRVWHHFRKASIVLRGGAVHARTSAKVKK